LLTIADDTDGRQIRRVHFISGDPLAGLALPILAVRRDDAEEVQKCPEGLAIGRGQQLNEMLKSFLLQPPVSDLWKNIGMARLLWPHERAGERLNRKIENGFAAEIAEGGNCAVERAGKFGADNVQGRVVLGLRAKAGKRGDNDVERFSRFRN